MRYVRSVVSKSPWPVALEKHWTTRAPQNITKFSGMFSKLLWTTFSLRLMLLGTGTIWEPNASWSSCGLFSQFTAYNVENVYLRSIRRVHTVYILNISSHSVFEGGRENLLILVMLKEQGSQRSMVSFQYYNKVYTSSLYLSVAVWKSKNSIQFATTRKAKKWFQKRFLRNESQGNKAIILSLKNRHAF